MYVLKVALNEPKEPHIVGHWLSGFLDSLWRVSGETVGLLQGLNIYERYVPIFQIPLCITQLKNTSDDIWYVSRPVRYPMLDAAWTDFERVLKPNGP